MTLPLELKKTLVRKIIDRGEIFKENPFLVNDGDIKVRKLEAEIHDLMQKYAAVPEYWDEIYCWHVMLCGVINIDEIPDELVGPIVNGTDDNKDSLEELLKKIIADLYPRILRVFYSIGVKGSKFVITKDIWKIGVIGTEKQANSLISIFRKEFLTEIETGIVWLERNSAPLMIHSLSTKEQIYKWAEENLKK